VSEIKDASLVSLGQNRIEWAGREMPVLKKIRQRFLLEKPFKGSRISACLHVTTETANLILALKDGGAEVTLVASNPLSTQDDVSAALASQEINVYALKGEDEGTYRRHILKAIAFDPHMTIDDGADLTTTIHQEAKNLAETIWGGTEETTTGVTRLKNLEKAGKLKYPIIAVNNAKTKYLFDNRYGTGQSTIDGITRATNILWAGKKVVVAGYGWCGHGIALRAKGLGARVIVTEVDPLKALEAIMDGYMVMPLKEAAPQGDIFITATGNRSVIDEEHFKVMKDGAILANSGHFNVEINVKALEALSLSKKEARPMVDEYSLPDGRRLYLLAEGRLVNLAAAEGHPSSVMDMSFSCQALNLEYIINHKGDLRPSVYMVTDEIDQEIASLKLASLGASIDQLTEEQKNYLSSWKEGT
jgi:adenosylhomocysteinase